MCNIDARFFEQAETLRRDLPNEQDPDMRRIMREAIDRYYVKDCTPACSMLEQKANVILNLVQEDGSLVKENTYMAEIKNSNIGSTIIGSNTNQGATLYQVSQDINNAKSSVDDSKKELYELMEKLLKELETIKDQHPKPVNTITRRVDAIGKEVASDEPDGSILSVTANGLVEAAKTIETVASTAFAIANQIALFILKHYPPA